MACSFGKIDLHIHSTASDGSFTPVQILENAVEKGLSAIAITDHDTVAGVEEALCHGIPETLAFFTGIEISAAFPPALENAGEDSGSLHILGYGIQTGHPELGRMLKKQRSARSDRSPLIIEKLNALGIPVSTSAVTGATGKKDIARPHIAAFLVKNGYAKDIDDAFDRLLGRGKPAYVDKYRIPADSAISLIRAAGGISVLAHPGLLLEPLSENEPGADPSRYLERLLDKLVSFGLGGIEVYYPGHSAAWTAFLAQAAEKRGLLATGGTDFHGDINPDIEMGTGRGSLTIPCQLIKDLKNALSHG